MCRFDHCRTVPLAEGAAQKLAWPVSQWKLEEAKLGRLAYKQVALNTVQQSCSVPFQALAKVKWVRGFHTGDTAQTQVYQSS